MKRKLCLFISVVMLALPVNKTIVSANMQNSYKDYQERSNALTSVDVLSQDETGYSIKSDFIFDETFKTFGMLKFVPIKDEKYNKLIICLVDESGNIIYKTNYLETNSWNSSGRQQYFEDLLAVHFQDIDQDGYADIVIVSECSYRDENGLLEKFKVGDILYQKKNGLFSNWETTNKINKYSMNRNFEMMADFATGKDSMEFLYTSTNFNNIISKGFKVHKKHTFTVDFEEFGQVTVYPGFYPMAGLRTFIIYLVDSQNRVCALLQPMKEYDDLVEMQAISFSDVNQDGLKDITVLAYYRQCREVIKEKELDYVTFFQNSLWFERDQTMEKDIKMEKLESIGTIIKKSKDYLAGKTVSKYD